MVQSEQVSGIKVGVSLHVFLLVGEEAKIDGNGIWAFTEFQVMVLTAAVLKI